MMLFSQKEKYFLNIVENILNKISIKLRAFRKNFINNEKDGK